MKYSAPVLLEVGQVNTLVLGGQQTGDDSGTSGETLPFELALGLDE